MFAQIQNLISASGTGQTAGTVLRGEYTNRKLTDLVLSFDDHTTVEHLSLNVELRTKSGKNHVLVPNVPLRALAGLSDIKGGQSRSAKIVQGDIDAVGAGTTVTAEKRDRFSFFVNFGGLLLSASDTLYVSLNVDVAFGASDAVRLSAYCRNNFTSEFIKTYYRYSGDSDITVDGVCDVVLFRENISGGAADEATGIDATKCTVLVEDVYAGESQSFGADTCVDIWLALGEVDTEHPRDVILVDSDIDGSKAAPQVRLRKSGAESSDWDFLVCAMLLDAPRISASGIQLAHKRKRELQSMEQKDQAGAVARRHGGLQPKAIDMERVQAMREASYVRKFR